MALCVTQAFIGNIYDRAIYSDTGSYFKSSADACYSNSLLIGGVPYSKIAAIDLFALASRNSRHIEFQGKLV